MKTTPNSACLCRALLPALCAWLLQAAPALAADTAPPTTLDTVRVVDTRSGELPASARAGSALGLSVLQTPAALTVISRDQLEQRGDTNLNDAISRAAVVSPMGRR
ncbi:hypothetical protein G6F65_021801 [Rhizopus arrhizus]|nr:hypothetical protein G6F65_021801 [Rhizopus arrhizus]